MAQAQVDQADGNGPAAGRVQRTHHVAKQPTFDTFEETFTNQCWHYVSNNMTDRKWRHIVTHPDGFESLCYDGGWQFVPLCVRSCMTPAEWREFWQKCSAFRIKRLEAKISEYTPLQEHQVLDESQVRSGFIKDPPLWVATDPNRIFDLRGVLPKLVGQDLYSPNNNLRHPLPTSYEDGKLKRCILDLGSEAYRSINEFLDQRDIPLDVVNDVNGLLNIDRLEVGEERPYATDLNSAEPRWYQVGNYNTSNMPELYEPNRCKPYQCPTEPIALECNDYTMVNHNCLDTQKLIMVRMEDYHTTTGKLDLHAKIKITYSVTFEGKKNIHIGMRPLQNRGESRQLRNIDEWERTAIPREWFSWGNRPQTLTKYRAGVAYSATHLGPETKIGPAEIPYEQVGGLRRFYARTPPSFQSASSGISKILGQSGLKELFQDDTIMNRSGADYVAANQADSTKMATKLEYVANRFEPDPTQLVDDTELNMHVQDGILLEGAEKDADDNDKLKSKASIRQRMEFDMKTRKWRPCTELDPDTVHKRLPKSDAMKYADKSMLWNKDAGTQDVVQINESQVSWGRDIQSTPGRVGQSQTSPLTYSKFVADFQSVPGQNVRMQPAESTPKSPQPSHSQA